MPSSLLDSQLATLEPPAADEAAITLDITPTTAAVVASALAGLQTLAASTADTTVPNADTSTDPNAAPTAAAAADPTASTTTAP